MINYTFGLVITIINAFVLIVLIPSYIQHKNCLKIEHQKESFYIFHNFLFYVTGVLLLANSFAFITALYGYFVIGLESPDFILFGRLADRYSMFLAYIGLRIMGGRLFKVE